MSDTNFRPYAPSDAERSDRSAGDRARHRVKIRESIRENISDIIAEESIIGQNRDRIIKVPIRGIREYRFVYGDNNPSVGQGNGKSESGQVVGKAKQQGQGTDKAGDQAGADYYETAVTLERVEVNLDLVADLDLGPLELFLGDEAFALEADVNDHVVAGEAADEAFDNRADGELGRLRPQHRIHLDRVTAHLGVQHLVRIEVQSKGSNKVLIDHVEKNSFRGTCE